MLVTSPNGGERLTVGQTYTINTVTNKLPVGTSVLLQLHYSATGDCRGGCEEFEDGIGAYAGGEFKWTVPAKYASPSIAPDSFQIHAILVGPDIPSTNPPQDYSDRYFTIDPQPCSLTVTTNIVSGAPVYQLNGAAGYSYDIQASTNLVDWATIATLVNTNGTALFSDQDFTRYSMRFYRGVRKSDTQR